MKNFYRNCRLHLWLACLVAGFGLLSCADNNETGGGPTFDPSQPIELESFSPKTGPIATQVIIKGKNFGTDTKNIAVYFNEKRAAIISSTGERMLVLAPKLPGDKCVVSVTVGDKKEQFDEVFDYITLTSVSTLVGGTKGASMPAGTTSLSAAQFADKSDAGMAIDSKGNLFAAFKNLEDGKFRIYMMNEEAGNIKSVTDFNVIVDGPLLGYDYQSDVVYLFHTNLSDKSLTYFDPKIDYAKIDDGSIKWDVDLAYTSTGMSFWGGRQGITMNPTDHKFYFYTNEGTVARYDPKTGKGENLTTPVFKESEGDVMGIAFDPRDHNISYFAVRGKHCIYKHNISEGTVEVWAGRKNSSGYLDGALDEAQFNSPCQMCNDDEYIYVADRDNHCIRKITLATGYVSTLAGTPKSSGYANGPAESSKFNKPCGLVIDSEGILYVNDTDNYAIRRVATE